MILPTIVTSTQTMVCSVFLNTRTKYLPNTHGVKWTENGWQCLNLGLTEALSWHHLPSLVQAQKPCDPGVCEHMLPRVQVSRSEGQRERSPAPRWVCRQNI